MREVHVDPIPLERLAALLEPERAARLRGSADRAQAMLDGRTVWNLNATASGGGVAEMLQALLAYSRGAGVDTRWLVLDGSGEFFRLTKRLHNLLHGSAGDGGPLGEEERRLYEQVLADNLPALLQAVRPGDVVLLHDPQTAGLTPGLRATGARIVWRSHIGKDTTTDLTEFGWEFLRRYVEQADAVIFSRAAYVPAWVDERRVSVIPPSLDPFTAKNGELSVSQVEAVLDRAGLVRGRRGNPSGSIASNGVPGVVRSRSGLIEGGQIVPAEASVVLQVSRWDRLKDMAGVLTGFAERLPAFPDDVHLMLVGPETSGVIDDPEGAEVFEECRALRLEQPRASHARIHLCSLPMDDLEENAYLVNALQRHASVVVQKSLVEGFGLTVTEPMWKGRPVVASRVGGIQDQIAHGRSGLLLDDPQDLDALGQAVESVLLDGDLAARLGQGAHERVRDHYLGDRHLEQYVDLFERL